MNNNKINELTQKIIGCTYTVSNTLGAGFLEKVYGNAMYIELSKNNLFVESQKSLNVIYDGQIVGEYFVDLFVENEVIVELKAVKALDEIHLSQIMNYLKAGGKPVGLLINFGKPKVEIKRVVNNFKDFKMDRR